MKKLSLIFAFIANIVLVRSQSFNTAFHWYHDDAHNMIQLNNNYYFASNVWTRDYLDSNFIYSVRKNGQLRFCKSYGYAFGKNERTVITQLIPTVDSCLVFTGFSSICDVLDTTQRTFIVKLDTNGNAIFDSNISMPYAGGQNDYLKDVIQYTDNSYFAISDSMLVHINSNGNLIKKMNTGFTGQAALTLLTNGHLLLSAKLSGIQKHLIIDTAANVIIQSNSASPVVKYKRSSSGAFIALYQNKTLGKLTASLLATGSSSLTQGSNIQLKDFVLKQDTVFACGQHSLTKNAHYFKFDSAFTVNYQFNNPTANIDPVGIAQLGNEVALLSQCASTQTLNTFISLTQFPMQGTFQFTNNIGVTSFSLNNSIVTANYYSIPNLTVYYAYYSMKVNVHNFGPATVNDFYLNNYENIMTNCGEFHFHQLYTNVGLAPGTSTVLTTGYFGPKQIAMMGGPPSSGNFSLGNICFYTSIPNGQNDFDVSNDGACATYSVSFTTGIQNVNTEVKELKIFPNPSRNNFIVEAAESLERIEIMDVTGRLIYSADCTGPKEEVPAETFSSGIYTIKIVAHEGRSTVRKLIKQD